MIYYSMSRPGIIIYECIRSVRVVIIPRIKMCLAVIFVYIVGRMDERIMIQRIVLSLWSVNIYQRSSSIWSLYLLK